MKTSILVAAIVACALAAPIVSAQETSAPAQPAMSMDEYISQMQENMETLLQQMEKLRTTTDPQERQKLMQEHLQDLQENMQTMRDMGGPVPDSGRRGGLATGGHNDMAGGDMMQQHELMEKRVDMLQMLID